MNTQCTKAELGASLLAAALGAGRVSTHDTSEDTKKALLGTSTLQVEIKKEAQPEQVPGLSAWLVQTGLDKYTTEVDTWCEQMGAASLDEIVESRAELADHLALGRVQRAKMEMYATKVHTAAVAAAASTGGSGIAMTAATVAAGALAFGTGHKRTYGPPEDPDRYTILEKLGWGATATVFHCRRNDNGGCSFALKMVSLGKLKLQPNYTELVETLHQEVAILLSLQHARVVSLVDVVEQPLSLGIIMELVQGGSLETYMARHSVLPEAEASHIFVQLADGLAYIHGRGVIHQDLKPDNILIDEHTSKPERAEVKLADFGQARVLGDLHSTSPVDAGTPLYRAPEATHSARKKSSPDCTADLWSLGVVLFVMLVGSCPFSGSGADLERAIQRGNFSFHSDEGKGPPSKEAQSLVNGLLKVNPTKRLSLDWCLVHPFVAPAEALAKRLLHLGFEADPDPLQEQYWLPGVLCDAAAYALRRDLWKWMLRFRFSAMMQGLQVVVGYGDAAAVEWESVRAAHHELREVMGFHIGAKRPAEGNVEGALAKRLKEPCTHNTCRLPMSEREQSLTVSSRLPQVTPEINVKRQAEPEDEASARQRRLESRKQMSASGQSPKWNFGGRSQAMVVNDRFREREAALERQRRLVHPQ